MALGGPEEEWLEREKHISCLPDISEQPIQHGIRAAGATNTTAGSSPSSACPSLAIPVRLSCLSETVSVEVYAA